MGIFLIGHHTLFIRCLVYVDQSTPPPFLNPIRYIILLWSAIFKSVYLPYDKCKLSVVNMNKVMYMANLSNLPVLNVYEVAILCPPRLKQYSRQSFSFTRLMDFVYKMYSLLNIDNKKIIYILFSNDKFFFYVSYRIWDCMLKLGYLPFKKQISEK